MTGLQRAGEKNISEDGMVDSSEQPSLSNCLTESSRGAGQRAETVEYKVGNR